MQAQIIKYILKEGKVMKGKVKKVICIVLCTAILICCMSVGASAYSYRTVYPFVFVHGLFGWGSDDGVNDYFSYWGMTNINLFNYLERQGYECINAGVGTISSAWDRACELYAQLVGGTVDYGAAHSAEHNHDRYGVTYDEPLLDQWDSEHKINLVGHSFGGATTRLFVQLLAEGSEEERAATPEDELSPLFKGGLGDRVFSVTALAAPHNGTSFFEASGWAGDLLVALFCSLAVSSGSTRLSDLFDPTLGQFGVSYELDLDAVAKLDIDYEVIKQLLNSKDTAFYDLTIDGAAELNSQIEAQPNIYYYSYAGSRTHLDESTGNYVPDDEMWPLLKPFAKIIGQYTGVTEGGYVIDEKWLESDGLVNKISALAPFDEPSVTYRTGQKTQPGIWYVMPVQQMDHLAFPGGLFNIGWFQLSRFYTEFMFLVTRSGK